MSDHPSERTSPLTLPPPPGTPAPGRSAYPPIPSGPRGNAAAGRGPRSSVRLGLIALGAALLGAVIGSGAMLAYTNVTSQPAAAPPASTAGNQVLTPTVEAREEQPRIAAVAAAVVPSVVQVSVDNASTPMGGTGNGSGVIYRSDGYIITNNHVIGNGQGLEVVLSDGTHLPAKVVGRDPTSDLAVLRVDRSQLPAIQIGDSSQLQVGEVAIAVGSPFDLEGTVTVGVISGLHRGPIRVGSMGQDQLTMTNLIQTDAPINPGNSGGALVDGQGQLIGINSAILTRGGPTGNAGVGFAIPVNTVVDVVDELIEKGVVHRPFLGVEGTTVRPSDAERLGVSDGAYVESVVDGTPAEKAGLASDDVIVALDGEPITSMNDLVVAVRDAEVGDTVTVTYVRDGQKHQTQATLAKRPENG